MAVRTFQESCRENMGRKKHGCSWRDMPFMTEGTFIWTCKPFNFHDTEYGGNEKKENCYEETPHHNCIAACESNDHDCSNEKQGDYQCQHWRYSHKVSFIHLLFLSSVMAMLFRHSIDDNLTIWTYFQWNLVKSPTSCFSSWKRRDREKRRKMKAYLPLLRIRLSPNSFLTQRLCASSQPFHGLSLFSLLYFCER